MKSYNNLDLNLNSLLNFKADPVSAVPSTKTAGRVIYNTSDSKLYYSTATAWIPLEANVDTDTWVTYDFAGDEKGNFTATQYIHTKGESDDKGTKGTEVTVKAYTAKGDVTIDTSGDTIIGDKKVTYAKIQDVAKDTVLGRKSATNGVVEELTKDDLLTLLGITINDTAIKDGSTDIPTANAVYDFVKDQLPELLDVLVYQGGIDSLAKLPAKHRKGDVYVVTKAFSSESFTPGTFEVGDMFICNTTRAEQNYKDWDVINTNWNVGYTATPTLSWSEKTNILEVGGVTVEISALPELILAKHFSPTADASSFLDATKDSDGNTVNGAVTGIQRDSKGHVTGITTTVIPKVKVYTSSNLSGNSGSITVATSGVHDYMEVYAIDSTNKKVMLDIYVNETNGTVTWYSDTKLVANTHKVRIVIKGYDIKTTSY